MKNYRHIIVVLVALGFLLAFVVSQRVHTFIRGYQISKQEKEINALQENTKQNEVNLSYLKSKQMLLSTAMAMRVDMSEPKNIQIVRKGDTLDPNLTLNEQSPAPPAQSQPKTKPPASRKTKNSKNR